MTFLPFSFSFSSRDNLASLHPFATIQIQISRSSIRIHSYHIFISFNRKRNASTYKKEIRVFGARKRREIGERRYRAIIFAQFVSLTSGNALKNIIRSSRRGTKEEGSFEWSILDVSTYVRTYVRRGEYGMNGARQHTPGCHTYVYELYPINQRNRASCNRGGHSIMIVRVYSLMAANLKLISRLIITVPR